MTTANASSQRPHRPPWLPRFGLAEMMLAMMIFSVMGAAGSYLMRAINQGTTSGRAVFVIFTLAAPMALVMVLSFYATLKRWLANRP